MTFTIFFPTLLAMNIKIKTPGGCLAAIIIVGIILFAISYTAERVAENLDKLDWFTQLFLLAAIVAVIYFTMIRKK